MDSRTHQLYFRFFFLFFFSSIFFSKMIKSKYIIYYDFDEKKVDCQTLASQMCLKTYFKTYLYTNYNITTDPYNVINSVMLSYSQSFYLAIFLQPIFQTIFDLILKPIKESVSWSNNQSQLSNIVKKFPKTEHKFTHEPRVEKIELIARSIS